MSFSVRQRRAVGVLLLIVLGGGLLATGYRALLGSSGLYLTPDAFVESPPLAGTWLMVGGIVENFTRDFNDPLVVRFELTHAHSPVGVPVSYRGILPDLFEEGEEAAVRGVWHSDGILRADEVLAKHDEQYSVAPPQLPTKK